MARRRRNKIKQLKKIKFRVNPQLAGIIGFLFIFLISVIGLGYAIYRSAIFKVSINSINANVGLSPRIKSLVEGKSLFAVDTSQIRNLILQENPEYKDVRAVKKFPGGLNIFVTKRKPYAQLKGKQFYLVDEEGVIINQGTPYEADNFIVIEADKDVALFRKGYHIQDEGVSFAFELIKSLKNSQISEKLDFQLINVARPEALYLMADLAASSDPKGLYKKARPGIKIIVGKNNFAQKISLLEEVVNKKFKDKLDQIQYIDLRYKEVYVGLNR